MALLRRIARWTLAAAVLTAPAWPARGAGTPISAEYQLKAVFLFNFAQFLEWPPGAFAGPRAPIVIGILGEDPFDGYLDGLVQGEKIGARPLTTRRYARLADAAGCHILFVGRGAAAHLGPIAAFARQHGILTVGDAEDFALRGGMVRFARQNGRIQLRINVAAAQAAHLTISARLLAHAIIVGPGGE